MTRYKHIFNALEKELNNKILKLEVFKIPVQNVTDKDALYASLPNNLKAMYADYIEFNELKTFSSEFAWNMHYNVIAESTKLRKFAANNTDLEILKTLIPDLYMVGGCVRDIINGSEPKDIDLCTSLSYEDVHKCLEEFENKDVGKQFLVNIVIINSTQYEIATFRKDKSNDGGIQGTIEEDAQRRDFTCNAMYFNLHTNELLDPNAGFEDVYSKTLQFIGKPKDRILEDACRVFRFYRFISEKSYKPTKKSLKAVREHFDYAVKNTASERIKNEIERITKIKG